MEGIFVLLDNNLKIKSRTDLVTSWKNNQKFSLQIGKETKRIFSKSDFPKNEIISLKSKKHLAVILN